MTELSTKNKLLFETVINAANNGLVIFNPQAEIELWNDWMQKQSGLSSEDVHGRKISDVFPELLDSRLEQTIFQAIQQGAASVLSQSIHKAPLPLYLDENDRRKNQRLDHSIVVKPIRLDSKERYCLLQINDVSSTVKRDQLLRSKALELQNAVEAQKRVEQELQESTDKLKSFLNGAPVMMWMLNAEGKAISFNDTWLKFIGRDLDDELAHAWEGDSIHPDDRLNCLKVYNNAIGTQSKFSQNFRMKRHDGVYRWLHEVGVPKENAVGEFDGYIGTYIDITDQKEAESKLKKYMDELSRSNEELEKFAYIASHDLQEPLRMVASYTKILANKYKDKLDNDANDYIEYAQDGARRMQVLINDLLEYSRVSTRGKTFTSVDCNSVFDDVSQMLRLSIDECGAIIRKQSLPTVMGDVSQLRQIFQNLIGNAIKYRTEDKQVEIDISVIEKGEQWQFSISDNGIGIEEKFFNRVFDVFQRLHTRAEYSGTGIGLAICKKIVIRHGGKIWIESTHGKGSTFHFTLTGEAKETVNNDDALVLSSANKIVGVVNEPLKAGAHH